MEDKIGIIRRISKIAVWPIGLWLIPYGIGVGIDNLVPISKDPSQFDLWGAGLFTIIMTLLIGTALYIGGKYIITGEV